MTARVPSPRTAPPVLVLQHSPWEGPGLIGDALRAAGLPMTVRNLIDRPDDVLPAIPDLAGVVLMGGPMRADDHDTHPGLAREAEIVRAAVTAGLPVLGVCLGHQIIATALGGCLHAGVTHEVGLAPVEFTGAGSRPPGVGPDGLGFAPGAGQPTDVTDATRGLGQPVENHLPDGLGNTAGHGLLDGLGLPVGETTVLQWHDDNVDAPDGAVVLASSAGCPVQAFAVGSALGLQFHPELTPSMLDRWLAEPEMRADLAGPGEEPDAAAAALRIAFAAEHESIATPFTPVFTSFARRCAERAALG
ncbi:hypothetical protein BKD30_11030 [Tersicoccus phoenicis]|uniref:Glutamine amidotransferase domain-containing protein n=1 Tax=Tersicoccus phoenicis TaxID=554083 RepID=A0A1R1L8N3_9MICC|nr:type 1 glutamine amidotransferase [Tersicoccus phoenicis]OMH23885.1 hypothetical protein BKD30_11030 [Tersicoccus phoenicis]